MIYEDRSMVDSDMLVLKKNYAFKKHALVTIKNKTITTTKPLEYWQ